MELTVTHHYIKILHILYIKHYTSLYIKYIKDLLYSTGNCIQHLAITYSGKDSEKIHM